jgi:flagellin-specific chaperone FliS
MLNLSPVEVIQKLYDTAIIGCKKNDQPLAQRALNELVTALDFEHQDLSLGLYRLYDYCKRNIRQGNTAEAIGVLEELRSTWAKAFDL